MSSNELAGASDLRPQDFDSIRDAVMETPRGRWFLHEYANRLRGSETATIIKSMKRLEGAVAANHDALMARLATAIARDAVPAAGLQTDLAPKHMTFFKQDEDIFEPAPQARISAVPDVSKPEPKPEVPKGARVVIRRAGEIAAAPVEALKPEVPFAFDPPPEPLPEPDVIQSAAAAEAEASPKRRIVIIRHKAGEQIDVPLQNEMSATG